MRKDILVTRNPTERTAAITPLAVTAAWGITPGQPTPATSVAVRATNTTAWE